MCVIEDSTNITVCLKLNGNTRVKIVYKASFYCTVEGYLHIEGQGLYENIDDYGWVGVRF